MKYLDLTLDDAAGNLACDEALLQAHETERLDGELLRVWEAQKYFVVLGHSNRIAAEVEIEACERRAIPVLRRMSGGGAVLQGPGCLNYSLILNGAAHRLKTIGDAFRFVLERHRDCIADLTGGEPRIEGISDLTLAGRKFSGNAQYRKSHYLLVHGTFLLKFDLSLIATCLRMPSKQPAYRAARSHSDFLVNIELPAARLRAALRSAWQAGELFAPVPRGRIATLVADRYARTEWSRKF
jgi:lipoate-protein ligase A